MTPPRLATLLLQWLVPTDVAESLIGDLHERFGALARNESPRRARLWYWREATRAAFTFSRFGEPSASGPVSQGDGRMWDFIGDVRYAIRSLLNRPGFAAITIATLALGIGATTAIFSAVRPILFEPLPYPNSDRLENIAEVDAGGSNSRLGFLTIADLAERNHTFAATSAVRGWGPTLTGDGIPALLNGQRVSQSFFRMLQVAPMLGRDFRPEEDVAGAPAVVILSYEFWTARFHGDSTLIGKQIQLNETPVTVIGVMPRGFQDVFNAGAQLWSPLRYGASLPYACRDCRHLQMVGRLRDGVTPAAAHSDLSAIQHAIVAEHPTFYPTDRIAITSLREQVTGAARPALIAVLAAVALVLLVACANVTNLLLVRGTQRRAEFSVRMALGARNGRLLRQVLTESVVLSLLGGVLGAAVSLAGVRLIVSLAPAALPRREAIHPDVKMWIFGFALTLLIGLVAGAIPALATTRADLADGLRTAGRRTAGGTAIGKSALVIAEVSLAVVLLVGSGLLLRSVTRLLSVPTGFRTDHLITMQVQEAGKKFANDTLARRFYADALERIRAVPGVQSVAMTSQLPFGTNFDQYGVHTDIDPDANPANDPSAFRYAVSPGYLETMGIHLVRGRTLQPSDDVGQPPVALVTAQFARHAYPGVDPIGRRFLIGDIKENHWYTIVGIVDEVRQVSLALPPPDAFYVAENQFLFVDGAMFFVARTHGNPTAAADAIRQAIWSVDRDQPITQIASMDELMEASAAQPRFVLALFEGFALVALVLAGAGIYGVLSRSVADRTREIGVRTALGASRGSILALVMRQGLTLTVIGLGAGIVGAAVASRVIASLLFGVTRVDLVTYGGVTLVIGAVAVTACWLPAWRAARVDPAITLRSD